MQRPQWVKKHRDEDLRKAWALESPLAFALEYPIELSIPGKGIVNFELYDFQQIVLLDDSENRGVNKMRQGGMTTAFGFEAMWKLAHVPGTQIVVISKNSEAAENFIAYVSKFYHAYQEQHRNLPKIGKDNLRFLSFPGQETWIKAVAADKRAGTSFTATELYFDEVAHSRYAEEIYESSMPTLAKTGGGATIFSSPAGKGNLHHRIHTNREQFPFSTHQFEWWWVPEWNPSYKFFYKSWKAGDKEQVKRAIARAREGAWYKRERPRYSKMQWEKEFECSFEADESNVFSARQLKNFFHGRPLERLEDPAGICSLLYHVEPKPGWTYWNGIDLGRKQDATVSITYGKAPDSSTYELVDFRYIAPQTVGWDYIVAELTKVKEIYKPYSRHDSTGIGDTLSGVLSWSEPYIISNQHSSGKKLSLINTGQRAMDSGVVSSPRIKQMELEHERYQLNDRGLQTDTVIANLLAISCFYKPADLFTGVEKTYSYV